MWFLLSEMHYLKSQLRHNHASLHVSGSRRSNPYWELVKWSIFLSLGLLIFFQGTLINTVRRKTCLLFLFFIEECNFYVIKLLQSCWRWFLFCFLSPYPVFAYVLICSFALKVVMELGKLGLISWYASALLNQTS